MTTFWHIDRGGFNRLKPGVVSQISLVLLAKKNILIIDKLSIVPAVVCSGTCMYLKWLDCHLPVAVVSQCISRPNAEKCAGFPPPLDSRRLRSRIA